MSLIRVLHLDTVDEIADIFLRFKWKFVETDFETITVEVPRGNETLIVRIDHDDDDLKALQNRGFIPQSKEYA